MKQLARRAFDVLGCTDWGRADFMLDADGNPYFLEVNTSPGMTDHSLPPKAARAVGHQLRGLVVRRVGADARRTEPGRPESNTMWNNVRQLNLAANALHALLVLVLLAAARLLADPAPEFRAARDPDRRRYARTSIRRRCARASWAG